MDYANPSNAPMEGAAESSLPAGAAAPIPWHRPPLVVGLLGWCVPGLGQLVVGRPDKALIMLIGIGGLYFWGLALTGFTCVNPNVYALEFAAHVFAGGPTALALYVPDHLTAQGYLPYFDVGRLYVAVAGLLNAVAISDAIGDAQMHNAEVDARRQFARRRHAESARREAEQRATDQRALEQQAAEQETTENLPDDTATPDESKDDDDFFSWSTE